MADTRRIRTDASPFIIQPGRLAPRREHVADEAAEVLPETEERGIRILCLDGGGIRGLNEIEMMKKIEEISGKRIEDLFDWIGGTSTGGILALGIATGIPLVKMEALYWKLSEEVFEGQKPYDCAKFETLLQNHFGTNTKMKDIQSPKVVITGTLGNVLPPKLHLFRSYELAGHQKTQLQGVSDIPYWVEVDIEPSLRLAKGRFMNLMIEGEFGNTDELQLEITGVDQKQGNKTYVFSLMAKNVGKIEKIKISNTEGYKLSLTEVRIRSPTCSNMFLFRGNMTFAKEISVTKTVDLKQEELVWEAARSTSAAPNYFKHFGPYWDGGLIANNPTLDILSEIQWHLKGSEMGKPNICCVVSLGCGRGQGHAQILYNLALPKKFTGFEDGLQFAANIKPLWSFANICLQEVTATDEHPVHRAMNWCRMMEVPFYRFSPMLGKEVDLDCSDKKTLEEMVTQTEKYINQNNESFENLVQLLTNNQKK